LIDVTLLSKALSMVAATGFVLLVFALTGSGESAFRALLFVLLPLMCIWFSDTMGRLTGISMGLGRPVITESTPGVFVAIGGWILLIAGLGVWFMGWVQSY
jgi:CDP-diglyceride synthetase